MRRRRLLAVALVAWWPAGCVFSPGGRAVLPDVPAEAVRDAAPAQHQPPAPASPYHAHPAEAPPRAEPPAPPEPRPEPQPLPPAVIPTAAVAPPDPALVAALRAVLDRRPDDALSGLSGHARAAALVALLQAAACVDAGLDRLTPRDAAALLARVERLEADLRARASLTLDNLCFYRRVHGFGQVEAVAGAPPAFQAGVDDRPGERVKVYAEVRNFRSRPLPPDGPGYETLLSGELLLCDAGGKQVVMRFPAAPERSRSPRHDLLVTFEFHVPPKVPPGLYTLRVVVRDELPLADGRPGPREATGNLDLRVVEPGATRGR